MSLIAIQAWRSCLDNGAPYEIPDFRDESVQYIKRCQKGLPLCPYGRFPKGDDYNLYLTKGDNNAITDQCSALIVPPITDENVLAKAYVRIPLVGWLKIFIEPLFNFWK